MKKIVSIICVLILSSSMIGAGAFYESDSKDILKMCSISNEGTEYWALLVGCNEFLNKPTLELPGNDISTEDLKNLLIISEQWTPNHIRVLTGENATWLNILKGFQWLDEMDDEDDICLFYISTHGMPGMGIDLWPKDEEDGDEMLMTYDTYRTLIGDWFINFPLRTHWITDDMLNKKMKLQLTRIIQKKKIKPQNHKEHEEHTKGTEKIQKYLLLCSFLCVLCESIVCFVVKNVLLTEI